MQEDLTVHKKISEAYRGGDGWVEGWGRSDKGDSTQQTTGGGLLTTTPTRPRSHFY